MATSLQEFLRQRADGTGIRERARGRSEWVLTVAALLDLIERGLARADPEALLEITRYTVQRVEDGLGIYDAPALMVRFGTDQLDVVPAGRYARVPITIREIRTQLGLAPTDGAACGRVDITDGERKYFLVRDLSDGTARWFSVDERRRAAPFDEAQLEAILLDLWS